MDYSQFLMMPQEIGLLVVFLLVFLYDTFMPSKTLKGLPLFATIVFGIFTIFIEFAILGTTLTESHLLNITNK